MKLFTRLVLVSLALTLTVGPVLAAPMSLSAGPHVSALGESRSSLLGSALTVAGYALAVFGMIKVKDTASIAQKYSTRASAATGDYKSGVANAGSDWEAGAKAGESNFEQGVQQAITDKRYGKGVTGSASKYQNNAVNLGSTRYAPGVQNAVGAYQAGVQPFLDKLKSLTLPPKGPRRSPQNQARANMVALELGKLKTGN